jgi:hypothetical protein
MPTNLRISVFIFTISVAERYKMPRNLADSLDIQPKQRKFDMIFGTWTVRSLYMADSLIVVKQLSIYKLHLIGIQELRREKCGTEPAVKYMFLFGKRNENHK